MKRHEHLALVLSLAVLFFVAVPLAAEGLGQTDWIHDPASPSTWLDPLNWSAGVPTATIAANIDNGGTVQISEGDCAAEYVWVGLGHNWVNQDPRIGHVEQTGGFLEIPWRIVDQTVYLGRLELGEDGGFGYYDLFDGGLVVPLEFIGGSGGTHGTGIFTQSGGSNIATMLYLGTGEDAYGAYNLHDGELSVDLLETIGWAGTGTFVQDGGTHVVNGTMQIGALNEGGGMYSYVGSTDAEFRTDAELSVDTLDIGPTGTFYVSNPHYSCNPITINRDFTLESGAKFTVLGNIAIQMINANFDNYSTSETDLSGLTDTSLVFQQTVQTIQTLEVGGLDHGPDIEGPFWIERNFAVSDLILDGNSVYVQLVDNNDNGNRGGVAGQSEALYVYNLYVPLGCTLDLNGLNLYYVDGNFGGTFANGSPIQATLVPEPATLAVIAPALLAFVGLAFRKMRKG